MGSSAPDGILAFDWDPVSGELTAAGVAAKVPKVAWLAFSNEHQYVYSASELDDVQRQADGRGGELSRRCGQRRIASAFGGELGRAWGHATWLWITRARC